jgi:hypothetical protein
LFPAMLTKKAGLDMSLVRMLAPLCDTGVGPTQVAKIMKEMHTRKFSQRELAYYDAIEFIIAKQKLSRLVKRLVVSRR